MIIVVEKGGKEVFQGQYQSTRTTRRDDESHTRSVRLREHQSKRLQRATPVPCKVIDSTTQSLYCAQQNAGTARKEGCLQLIHG
jgi:hypothetical protein